jgi:hypothetical protein
MTTDEINVALGKLDGFLDIHRCTRRFNRDPKGVCWCGTKDGPTINYSREYVLLPNYAGSLDSLAPLEAKLTDRQAWEYIVLLTGWRPGPMNFPILSNSEAFAVLRATPIQRATALVRLHGLWPSPAIREEGGRK